MDGGQVAVLLVHDANPVYALPKASGFAGRLRKVGVQGLDLAVPRRDRRPVRSAAAPAPRARAVGRPRATRRRAGPDAAGDGAGVRHPARRRRPARPSSRKAGGALARFDAPTWEAHLRARWASRRQPACPAGCRRLLARGAPARRRLRRRRAPAARSRSRRPRPSVSYTRPAFEGNGRLRPARRTRTPCCTTGEARTSPGCWRTPTRSPRSPGTPGSRSAPRPPRGWTCARGRSSGSPRRTARSRRRCSCYLGLHPDVVAMPLGLGHTEYGGFAKGRGVNALDLLGAPDGDFVPYLSTRVAVEKTGGFRPLASVDGVPRQLGRGIAESMPLEAARKGLTLKQAYLEEGHEAHEVNPEREVEAIEGLERRAVRGHPEGQLRRRAPPVGHGDRPGALHRLLRPASRRATPRTTSRPWASRRSSRAGR